MSVQRNTELETINNMIADGMYCYRQLDIIIFFGETVCSICTMHVSSLILDTNSNFKLSSKMTIKY